MSVHRFSHLMTESDAQPWNWTADALSPFATVQTTPIAMTSAAAQIYQAAFDEARRQLARRSLLFTWNSRQN